MLTDPAGRNSNDSSDSRNIFPSNIAFRSLDQLSLIHAWTSQDNLPSNGSSLLAKHHFPSRDYSSPFLVFPSSVEITMYGLKAVQPLEQYIRRSKATHRQHYLRRLNPKFHSVLVTRSLWPRSARSIVLAHLHPSCAWSLVRPAWFVPIVFEVHRNLYYIPVTTYRPHTSILFYVVLEYGESHLSINSTSIHFPNIPDCIATGFV